MKSPDEFHYGIEPKREKKNPNERCVIGTCPICGRCVMNDEYVIVFEDWREEKRFAHESCGYEPLTLTDLLEKLDVEYDSGRAEIFLEEE